MPNTRREVLLVVSLSAAVSVGCALTWAATRAAPDPRERIAVVDLEDHVSPARSNSDVDELDGAAPHRLPEVDRREPRETLEPDPVAPPKPEDDEPERATPEPGSPTETSTSSSTSTAGSTRGPDPEPLPEPDPEPLPEPDPEPTGPGQVRGLVAADRDATSISLTWDADPLHDDLHDYQLQRRHGSGDWTTIFFDQAPTTSYKDTGLSPATEYQYRVRARLTTSNMGAYSDVATASTETLSSSQPRDYPWVGQPTRAGSASEAFVGPWHQVNSESPARLDAVANNGALPSFVTNIGRAQFASTGNSQRARAIFEHGRESNVPYWTEGSEIWYGGFFYFAPGFKNSLNSSVDFHRWDAFVDGSNDMQGGLGIRTNGRLRIQNNWPFREPLVATNYTVPEGRWIHIEVGQKLSSSNGGGWSEIWVDGERIARSTNANFYGDRYSGNAARINRHRIGLFGSAQNNPIELRFAYQTIGDTRHGDPR